MSNQGGRRQSTEASSFPQLQRVASWPLGFSKNYSGHHHKAAWVALQLTTLPKTQGRPPRKARSRPKLAGIDSHLHQMPSLPKNWRAPLSHRRFCPDAMCRSWKSFVSIRCLWFLPLAEARDKFRRVVLPSMIPKPPKLSSTSGTGRSHEDVRFSRVQSASPRIHSALCRPDRHLDRNVRCTCPERRCSHLGLSLSRTKVADLGSTPPSRGACRWGHEWGCCVRTPVP